MKRQYHQFVAIFVLLTLIFYSCNLSGRNPDITYEYENSAFFEEEEVVVQTKSDGNVRIESKNLNSSLEITIVDEDGSTIDGYLLYYTEQYDELILWGYDPYGRYGQTRIEHSLDELQIIKDSDFVQIDYVEERSAPSQTSISKSATALIIIGVTLTVAAIAATAATAYIHFANAKTMEIDNYDGVYNGAAVIEYSYEELIDWFYKYYIFEEKWPEVHSAKGLFRTLVIDEAAEHLHPAASIVLSSIDIIGNVNLAINVNDPKGEEYEYIEKTVTEHLMGLHDKSKQEIEQTTFYLVKQTERQIAEYVENERVQVLVFGCLIFLTDPRLETLSGWYEVSSTVATSNNSSIYWSGKVFTGEAFIKSETGNNLKFYDFVVNESDVSWGLGEGEFDKITGDFSGEVSGTAQYDEETILSTINYSGNISQTDNFGGNCAVEDVWSPSGTINTWEGPFGFTRKN